MSRCAAPATKSHPPTSPNTAPATQNACHQDIKASHMNRHFQCVEQVKSPANLTKYCACHEILKLKISAETRWTEVLPPIERRFEDNLSMKLSSRTRRFGDLTRPILETILHCKIQHFALRLSPKMSRCAAPATKSHPPTSPNTAPATQNQCHQWSASHMKLHFQCAEQVKSAFKLSKYCACHAKRKLSCYVTGLFFDWAATLLTCYSTELWLYWTVTLLNCDSTELWLYWTVTLLNCVSTELWLYWTVTLLNCYSTELWLYWTVTLLNYWTVTLLNYWTVTLLNCYSTELWLYWTVTLLNCDSTELLLYWTVTLLNSMNWLYWTVKHF